MEALMSSLASKTEALTSNEADSLNRAANRFEQTGHTVTAILFRNEAWRMEQGIEWLSLNSKETENKR